MKKIVCCVLLMLAVNVYAETDPHEADRQQLREILESMKKALNAMDFDQASTNLHQEGVVTYYNAEVTVGHDQARQYFNRMLTASEAIVKEYRLKGDVSAPAYFYGDTAVAYGTTEEYYKLAKGLEFTLKGNWSATLAKQQGQWKIVNLHFSSNLFDNPLLNTANAMHLYIGTGAFLGGLLLMFVLMRLLRKQ